MLPIPPPSTEGFTATPIPLYWCRYAARNPRASRTPRAPSEAGAPPGTLVVLHGGPGAHHEYLLPQLLDLARDRDCLFYDQRGGGRSRTDEQTPITWRTHVEDLTALISELAPGPVSLVGYSWGALLAMLYAVEAAAGRAGRLPARLVLLDPAAVTPVWRAQFEAEFTRRQSGPTVTSMREELAASGLREIDPAAYRQRTFELSVAGYFADPRRARDLTPFRVTGRVQESVWASLAGLDLLPALRQLRMPTLVVHGRQDPIPLESAEAVAAALGAERLWLDDCGHVPYVEQPGPLFAALRDFLDRTDAALTL